MKKAVERPTSYWLGNGDMIFPYDANTYSLPRWIIMRRGKRRPLTDDWENDPIKNLSRFYGEGSLSRYRTEAEAKEALYHYALEHGLKPAY